MLVHASVGLPVAHCDHARMYAASGASELASAPMVAIAAACLPWRSCADARHTLCSAASGASGNRSSSSPYTASAAAKSAAAVVASAARLIAAAVRGGHVLRGLGLRRRAAQAVRLVDVLAADQELVDAEQPQRHERRSAGGLLARVAEHLRASRSSACSLASSFSFFDAW